MGSVPNRGRAGLSGGTPRLPMSERDTEPWKGLTSSRERGSQSWKFIHRSTLAYRLERIESLTGIDFSDDATWTHLVLSFLL